MSYILEALKKAEAEREKGTVPGLRSQAWSKNSTETSAKAGLHGRWLAIGLLLGAMVGFSLWLWRQGAVAEAPPVAKPSEIGVASSLPSTTAAVVPAPAPVSALPVASPAAVTTPAAVVQAAAKPKAVKASAPAVSASDRVLKWADLSPTEQQKLPKLRWGGAMFSPDPSARMVILNDQVMREGDSIAPGLVLERIDTKSVILNLHGQHIRWDF